MFEQSLYETETPAPELQEGDLFDSYEIKSWTPSPRLYRILGLSAAANLLVLIVAAQTSVLTMKGCDSPLVGSVCQAIDMVYVGSKLFSTKRDYVDTAYEKTDLSNADITFVDVTANESLRKLEYPDDYYAIANPEEFAMIHQQDVTDGSLPPGYLAPGIPGNNFPSSFPGSTFPKMRPSTGGGLFNTKPKLAKPRPDVDDNQLPDITDSGPPNTVGNKRRKPNQPGKGNSNSTAQNGGKEPVASPSPTPANADPTINKRPFVDLGNKVNDLLDKNQVKLDSAFIVNASGKLTKDGKLDSKSFKYGQVSSQDKNMVIVVQESIQAINDSGYLSYLTDISGKNLNLMLQQDDANITAVLDSEMESDSRAKSIASSLNLLIGVAKMKKQGAGADQNDKDDLVLLENAKVVSSGKKVVISFLVPKNIALPMIQRKLAEQKAAPRTPNGNNVSRLDDSMARR